MSGNGRHAPGLRRARIHPICGSSSVPSQRTRPPIIGDSVPALDLTHDTKAMTHDRCSCSRRSMLRSLAAGSLLFPGIVQLLLSEEARGDSANPLAPRASHFAGRAKRVIFLYMSGGVSHLDTFDPKPRLVEDAGKPSSTKPGARPYLRPFWDFKPGGSCGTMISDLFPHLRQRMDDICLIRSLHGDHQDHFQATLGIHTG